MTEHAVLTSSGPQLLPDFVNTDTTQARDGRSGEPCEPFASRPELGCGALVLSGGAGLLGFGL